MRMICAYLHKVLRKGGDKILLWMQKLSYVSLAPQRVKIDKLRNRLKELQELSHLALLMGDEGAYGALQAEMREVFLEMLPLLFLEFIAWLLPHVLVITVLSYVWKTVTILGYSIHIAFWYPVVVFLIYLLAKKLRGVSGGVFSSCRRHS